MKYQKFCMVLILLLSFLLMVACDHAPAQSVTTPDNLASIGDSKITSEEDNLVTVPETTSGSLAGTDGGEITSEEDSLVTVPETTSGSLAGTDGGEITSEEDNLVTDSENENQKSITVTEDMQFQLNIFLSNFSELWFNEFSENGRNWDTFKTAEASPGRLIGFATSHCQINNPAIYSRLSPGSSSLDSEQSEDFYGLGHTYMTIAEVTNMTYMYFGRSVTLDDAASAGWTVKDDRIYWDIMGMGETYNHMTVVENVWEKDDGSYYVTFSIYEANHLYGAGPGIILDKSVYYLTPDRAANDPGVSYYMSGSAELGLVTVNGDTHYILNTYKLTNDDVA